MNILQKIKQRAINFSEEKITEEVIEEKTSQDSSSSIKIDQSKLDNPVTSAFIANTFNKYNEELFNLIKEKLNCSVSTADGKLVIKTEDNIDEITYQESLARFCSEKWRGLGAYLFIAELATNYKYNSKENEFTYDWIVKE